MKNLLNRLLPSALIFAALTAVAQVSDRQYLWPADKMPDAQPHQIAAMLNVAQRADFVADDNRIPFIEWFERPDSAVANGCCMVLISGGAYETCCDISLIDRWHKTFTDLGYQCVNLVYRTPWPEGMPVHQTAWEDGQRAIRLIRSQAAERGFAPDKICTVSMSAGSHLALMLGTSSLTPAYKPIDQLDTVACNINYAIVNAPAVLHPDSISGKYVWYNPDTEKSLRLEMAFDSLTCPMSLHHGGLDPYTPITSTQVYRQLRRMGIPAELHLYPGKGHGAYGLERGVEFLNQLNVAGNLQAEEDLMSRYGNDDARGEYLRQTVWPEKLMPDPDPQQCEPYLEWHFPKKRTTDAIQIIYSGGSYMGNDPDGFEVAPARRSLNDLGMTVVTMRYRSPRPAGKAKHISAWQDLQRAVRLVRSQAKEHGLDPEKIGIMGSSAGGHLTLMGVTSSMAPAYEPIDSIDALPCNVQWGIAIYPAYALTDGLEEGNTTGGNDDSAVLAPEFAFDEATVPMLFIHGDADGWAAMNSVKSWERLRDMNLQSELHTLALRPHCFQRTASPGTGSHSWLGRISDFLSEKGLVEPRRH